MFYRLKSTYALRGWDKMAWVLVKRPNNQIQQLSEKVFQALLLCDGETELSENIHDNTLRDALEKCKTDGLIEMSTCAYPLNPDQYYRYYRNRFVESVFWSITGRCNYHCRHCYMDAPGATLGELSTIEALHLIDQMAECGVLKVDITGGEPFVRQDFWQLIDRIVYHKIAVGMIYTNGWLVNNAILDKFESRGMKPEISISFDGIGWHDWMRGKAGAENAALSALKLCQERDFITNVEMCIHHGNRNTLVKTVETLCSVGVSALRVGSVTMTELWKKNNGGNILTEEEYIETALQYIPDYYRFDCPIELMFGGVIDLHRNGTYEILAQRYDGTDQCLNCYLCSGVRWSCYITPEGRLLPCMPMTASPLQHRFPKAQYIGLKYGLSDSLYMQFVDKRVKDLLAVNKECASCNYRYQCGGGCRATALLEGDQNLMGCDRNMCTLWKGGYVERIRKAADDAIAKYGVPSKKGGSSEVDA